MGHVGEGLGERLLIGGCKIPAGETGNIAERKKEWVCCRAGCETSRLVNGASL